MRRTLKMHATINGNYRNTQKQRKKLLTKEFKDNKKFNGFLPAMLCSQCTLTSSPRQYNDFVLLFAVFVFGGCNKSTNCRQSNSAIIMSMITFSTTLLILTMVMSQIHGQGEIIERIDDSHTSSIETSTYIA